MFEKHLVIAGGSGFIGRALAREFALRKFEVIILTRTPQRRSDRIREVAWDGKNLGAWGHSLDGAAAVINLTGKNINCPHTPENLRQLSASRVDSVNAIAAAIAQASNPPAVWVQASATGFYGDTGDHVCDETSPPGTGALVDICGAWENAFQIATPPTDTRKTVLRIGFVLGRDGGALPVLSRLTRLFLGGAVGNGRQYISWIHLDDLVHMFTAAVEDKNCSGTFNAVAPNPVTNAEFMRALRHSWHRPWSPPVPTFAVRLGAKLMQSEPSLALISCRVAPRRFAEAEFHFRFAQVAAALRDLKT